VPEDFTLPMERHHVQAEIRARIGDPHDLGGVLFADADEKVDVRRLTWALIHDPEARAMLSKLTRRRDAFVAKEGDFW
jgi:hypothetical protein